MGCPKARNSNKVPSFLIFHTTLLHTATSTTQTTTTRGLVVCWSSCGTGRFVVVGRMMWHHHTTFPHRNHVRHNAPPPVREITKTQTTHNNHTTTIRGLVVCWSSCGAGRFVVGRVMWHHHTTFPHHNHNHVRHNAPQPVQEIINPNPHQQGEAQLQGCHKTSQIELCCRTSGDYFGLHGIRTRSLRFLSFTQHFFSPNHLTTRHFNHTTTTPPRYVV